MKDLEDVLAVLLKSSVKPLASAKPFDKGVDAKLAVGYNSLSYKG